MVYTQLNPKAHSANLTILVYLLLVGFKLGEHHLCTADGFEQEVAIERFFKHPRYGVTYKYNYDVALLKLNTEH